RPTPPRMQPETLVCSFFGLLLRTLFRALWKRKRDIFPANAERYIFPPIDFVDGGRTLRPIGERGGPQHFSGVLVVSANFALDGGLEQEPARRHGKPRFRTMILDDAEVVPRRIDPHGFSIRNLPFDGSGVQVVGRDG